MEELYHLLQGAPLHQVTQVPAAAGLVAVRVGGVCEGSEVFCQGSEA